MTGSDPVVPTPPAEVPPPRNPRTAPTRDDVLEFHRLLVKDGDPDALGTTIDYALSYADSYDVPRWDQDRIVIENGWLEGRCGRCGEDLPDTSRMVADAERAARVAALEEAWRRIVAGGHFDAARIVIALRKEQP